MSAAPKTPRQPDKPTMFMVHRMLSPVEKPQGIVVPIQYLVPKRTSVPSKQKVEEAQPPVETPGAELSQVPETDSEVYDSLPRITSVVGSYVEPKEDAGTSVANIADHCYFKDVAMEIEQGEDSNASSKDEEVVASYSAVEKDHNYRKIPTGAECRVSCSLDFQDAEETRDEDNGNSTPQATYRKKVLEVPVETKEDQENLQREIRIHKGTLQKVTGRYNRSKSTLKMQKKRLKHLQDLLFSERVVQKDGRDVVEVNLSKYAMELFADGGFPTKDGEMWGAEKRGVEEVADTNMENAAEELGTSEVPTDS